VAFVGDSNLVYAARSLESALLNRDYGYIVVSAARPGAGIRMDDCEVGSTPSPGDCPTYNYWKARLTALRAAVKPSIWVVELGIVDAVVGPGEPDGPGYSNYGAKIDWLMALMPGRVVWTNLPCKIEPLWVRKGCQAVNAALNSARARYSRLTISNWASAANRHRRYIDAYVHLTRAGQDRYAQLIARNLDARF
jgi:hypothetical protein